MPGRTLHNLWDAILFNGQSGNDLHQYMDRAAKRLRTKHREVGHDVQSLVMMLFQFNHKYTSQEIISHWASHKFLDGLFSGIQAGVRAKNKGYGKKKDPTMEIIKNLKKEIFRL